MSQAQTNARNFAMHRHALVTLLEQIPAEKGDFSAWDGGMSFKALTHHLAASTLRMNAMVAGQTPEKIEPSPDFATALNRLKATTEPAQAVLAAMTDEQLTTVIEAFGSWKMSLAALIDFLIQHEAHHKGQVWMMARMIGIQPPMFVRMGD